MKSTFLITAVVLKLVLLTSPAQAEEEASTKSSFELRTIKRCDDPSPAIPEQTELALEATVLIKTEEGMGSGVIISPDGHILTAAHVVTQNIVEVNLRNGKSVSAELLRSDAERDVALLLLKGTHSEWPCLKLRETPATIGEDIYVLGSPAGEELSFSISRGIVSGLRKFKGTEFLQTDAAINPGNSGGPLVGQEGEVRATASWKVASTDMEGLGFGVPSSTALAALGLEFGGASDHIAIAVAPTVESAADEEEAYDSPEYLGPPQRPLWVRPVRSWGYLIGTLGVTTLLTNWLLSATLQDDMDPGLHKTLRTVGWIGTGVGTTAVVASYVFGQPKTPKARQSAGGSEGVQISLGVAGTGLSIQGSY